MIQNRRRNSWFDINCMHPTKNKPKQGQHGSTSRKYENDI